MLELLIIFAVCALAGLACLGIAVWVPLTPETLNVDKIFAIIACLLMALVFFSIAAWTLYNTRLRELLRPVEAPGGAQQPAAQQSEQVPQEVGKAG